MRAIMAIEAVKSVLTASMLKLYKTRERFMPFAFTTGDRLLS